MNAAPGGTSGLSHGRAACVAALHEILCSLAAPEPGGWAPSTLLLIDDVFADWPLDEPAAMQALQGWLRPAGRRLRIVGLDFDAVARTHPRFSRWRRDWAHRIEALCPCDGHLAPGLRGLQAGPVAALWLDAPDWCLRRINDPRQLQILHEQSAAFLQRCEPAWPVTTLGL